MNTYAPWRVDQATSELATTGVLLSTFAVYCRAAEFSPPFEPASQSSSAVSPVLFLIEFRLTTQEYLLSVEEGEQQQRLVFWFETQKDGRLGLESTNSNEKGVGIQMRPCILSSISMIYVKNHLPYPRCVRCLGGDRDGVVS